ncbi:hypothetical protein F5Y09DRAFT_298858, partial [Xylaria sp. FL1042]
MISYPSPGANIEHPFTRIYNPSTSSREDITSKDRSRRMRRLPSTTLPIYRSPQPDIIGQANTRRLSPSHLQAPHESPYSPTPESATPRTRQFQDSMLSLLSLLPPDRYQSPSPSIEEHPFEDETQLHEHHPGVDPASLASSAHVASIYGPSRNLSPSSPSSCSLLEFCEDLSDFEDGGWLGKG